MASVSRPRPKATTLAVHLTLTIDGSHYAVEPSACESGPAYRLHKHGRGGEVYDVFRDEDGLVVCDCADYEMRRKGLTSEPCKHGKALCVLGLLPMPAPYALAQQWPAWTDARSYAPRPAAGPEADLAPPGSF